MGQQLERVVGEVHPNLDAIERLAVFRRDEAEAADVFAVVEALADQEEDEAGVELFPVLLRTGDRKDEAATLRVAGVLPLGFDPLLEVLERVHAAPLLADEVAAWTGEYLRWRLSAVTRKLSRRLSSK